MIINESISGYIRSFEPDLRKELSEVEKAGLINKVPIIKKDAQSVLRYLINTNRPERILEIGTAIAFSTCYMAEFSDENTHITTIEKLPERVSDAQINIRKCGFEEKITLLEGDAAEILKKLSESDIKYDFVFLDAAKAQYGVYMTYINKLLANGGILLTDNILQEGSVADSKFSITRRDRTIHLRMREFISDMMKSQQYDSVIIPIGDGMLLSHKKHGG